MRKIKIINISQSELEFLRVWVEVRVIKTTYQPKDMNLIILYAALTELYIRLQKKLIIWDLKPKKITFSLSVLHAAAICQLYDLSTIGTIKEISKSVSTPTSLGITLLEITNQIKKQLA